MVFIKIAYLKCYENIDEVIEEKQLKAPQFIKKGILLIKKWLKIITIRQQEDKILMILPAEENSKLKRYQKALLLKLKILKVNKVVLPKNGKMDELKDSIQKENIEILDGRFLFKYLIDSAVSYISKKQGKEVQTQEVAVLVNDATISNVNNIVILAKQVKMLTIVTNHFNQFKKVENYLYDELGAMVRISNNKKKALMKADIIVNFDFPEEVLNQYRIPNQGVLINLEKKMNVITKSFEGINCNYYTIIPNKEYFCDLFLEYSLDQIYDSAILYESTLIGKHDFEEIRQEIEKKKIGVNGLIGNNGLIREIEFSKN